VSQTRNDDGLTVVPAGTVHGGETLDTVRSRLSGLHFAKEMLHPRELDVLLLAEALLAILDAEDPNGYRR
jgi:hypothetical protein